MPGLKAWDGSSFVDGEPRIWNGSTFVVPSACHVWDGAEFIKVWPTLPEEIMYTVTSKVLATSNGGTQAITNLQWLPAGDPATSAPLTPGQWMLLVYRAPGTYGASEVGVGVRVGGVDTFATMASSGSTGIFYLKFPVATAGDAQLIGKGNFSGRDILSPGDVIAFAPLPS